MLEGLCAMEVGTGVEAAVRCGTTEGALLSCIDLMQAVSVISRGDAPTRRLGQPRASHLHPHRLPAHRHPVALPCPSRRPHHYRRRRRAHCSRGCRSTTSPTSSPLSLARLPPPPHRPALRFRRRRHPGHRPSTGRRRSMRRPPRRRRRCRRRLAGPLASPRLASSERAPARPRPADQAAREALP